MLKVVEIHLAHIRQLLQNVVEALQYATVTWQLTKSMLQLVHSESQ